MELWNCEFTITVALTSGVFMTLIVVDPPPIVIATFTYLARLLRVQRDILMRVDQNKILCNVLDELMYHVGSSNYPDVGAAVLRCAVQMCEQHPHCIELITSRYKYSVIGRFPPLLFCLTRIKT